MNEPIWPQVCTCHDSSAVVAYTYLWLDWIMSIKIRAKRIIISIHLWDHPFVKWITDSIFTYHLAGVWIRDNPPKCELCLTHYPLASWIRTNPSSGNGLVPNGTKPLPEPVLTHHQAVLWYLHWDNFIRNVQGISLKITYLRSWSHRGQGVSVLQ